MNIVCPNNGQYAKTNWGRVWDQDQKYRKVLMTCTVETNVNDWFDEF